jgi:mannosyltransferase OCH1-like enzyme
MIPKIIWQTHKVDYSKLPEYMLKCSDTWKKMNPEYEYRYLDDKDMDAFILEHFGEEWLNLLNDCPIKIMKVDTFKYMLLYVYGGVYVDIDYICSAPIDSWSDKEQDLIIFQDNLFLEFTQAVFASSKNNIILNKTINNIKKDLKNLKVLNYKRTNLVGSSTGYLKFSKTIDSVLRVKTLSSLILNYNHFNNFSKVKEMKIYSPYFKNWDRFNPENPLFYSVNGRVTWEDNYGNWLQEQAKLLSKESL